MSGNNENNRKPPEHHASTDSSDEEASRGQDIYAGRFPSSPGSDETPQETSTGESSSAPKPEKETDTTAEEGDKPKGSPYAGGDDGD